MSVKRRGHSETVKKGNEWLYIWLKENREQRGC